jgi:hypothetical protein
MAKPWPELPLDAWRDTRDTLHLWTQIPGKVRLALSPPEPDWAHVTLYVTATGLTTGPVPCDGGRTFEIDFDFVDHALQIVVSDGSRRVIPLVPKTVKAFYTEVLEALRSLGIECAISPRPQEIPGAIPFDEDEVHRSYDPAWANRFFEVLRRVDMVMKEYRGRFVGRTTPVHFFWGTFDHAVTRYLDGNMLACGFWPGDDRFLEPAFFAYTYPKPDGIEMAAPWWNEQMGEFILPYESVRTAPSPRETLLDFFERTYEAGATRVSPTGQATPVPPSPQ